MIDWLSAFVGYDASNLDFGRVMRVGRDGQLVYDCPAWDLAVGSFDRRFSVRVNEPPVGTLAAWRGTPYLSSPRCLEVSGNPSMFLQGHNVVGPAVSLLGPAVQAVVRGFGDARPLDADSPTLPAVYRKRVDITTHVALGDDASVHDHLRVLASAVRSHQGVAEAEPNYERPETVYFQRYSRRWSLKVYCKWCDLLVHRPEVSPDVLEALRSFSLGHLRFELTLRRPELEHRGVLDESLIWDFYRRLRLLPMVQYGEGRDALRGPCKLAFDHWCKVGPGALDSLARRTKYKYRKEILVATGVDVLLPVEGQSPEARRVLLDIPALQAREVKDIPEPIQASMWKPLV